MNRLKCTLEEFLRDTIPNIQESTDSTMLTYELPIHKNIVKLEFNLKRLTPNEERIKCLTDQITTLHKTITNLKEELSKTKSVMYSILDKIKPQLSFEDKLEKLNDIEGLEVEYNLDYRNTSTVNFKMDRVYSTPIKL